MSVQSRTGSLPCQALVNNLSVYDMPAELVDLEKLEQIIIITSALYLQRYC